MEKVMWLVLGATVIVASMRAHRSDRARLVARVALGVLFLAFGAMVNLAYLVTDWDSFGEFGQMSQFEFVRDTWASVVAPNTGVFIGLWLWLYAVPMLAALALLLRAERHHRPLTATSPMRAAARVEPSRDTAGPLSNEPAAATKDGGRR